MLYSSTRNPMETASPAEAVLRGIAPDGGLYMNDLSEVKLDWRALLQKDFYGMAEEILGALLPDFGAEAMHRMIHAAYEGKFETADITPLLPVGDAYQLELFRGPTSAFKDVALSLLPQLITEARKKLGQQGETVILTATSGDTGKAALAGFRDVPGTRILVFYPSEGVSAIQQAQMVTQQGNNVCVCAVDGNFDDAQTGVKNIFAACAEKNLLSGKDMVLSSANSINIGRLTPQIVYYFKAYADLVRMGRIQAGENVNFVVPTGNFGNILAGYLAKRLGLPVAKLLCASNANDVLTEFLRTGSYNRRRPFYKTSSPSMDILVSSNLERLLYLASDGDAAMVAEKMQELSAQGFYEVSPALLAKIQETFLAGCCGDEAADETTRELWEQHHTLCDPHTAVAWNVYAQCRAQLGDTPTVVLSTASPFKFAPAVLRALRMPAPRQEFACMEMLHTRTGVPVPANLAALSELPCRHSDRIPKEAMLDYVLRKMEEPQWNR